MCNKYKKLLLIVIATALVAQLTGCFYRDERWHHDHDRMYEHPEHHDPSVDVHFHG